MNRAWKKCGWAVGVAMLGVLMTSCANIDRSGLQSRQSATRVKAILSAGERNDVGAIPLIIDRLDDDDVAVRSVAIQTLKRMTGEEFGYRSFDNVDVRSQAVARWRAWLKESRMNGKGSPSTQQAKH